MKIIIFLSFLFFNLFGNEIQKSSEQIEIKQMKEELAELNKYKDMMIQKKKIELIEKERNKKLSIKNINNKNTTVTMINDNSGRVLYRKCSGCHGSNGTINALGYSKQISKMTPTEIKLAIIGYQKGTYGGRHKTMMKNSVMGIRDINNIHILANYISDLDN